METSLTMGKTTQSLLGVASSGGASRCSVSAGKALTAASAAKPERTAKREKRIVVMIE